MVTSAVNEVKVMCSLLCSAQVRESAWREL